MSYRELRNIAEMTRALGFPRLLSIENFRQPNFKLVAELLDWIVKRFDPSVLLNTRCSTEQERVLFIKSAVLLLLQNARLKLNPRKLYQADGYAVQELLIAIRVLYDASKSAPEEDANAQWTAMKAKLNSKMQDVRICRQLVSQLPQTGAAVHDLLGKELYYRSQRNRASARAIPLAEAERAVQQSMHLVAAETSEIQNKLNNISSDEASLDEKIARKKREFDQMQKRLAKLQSFRPQYMDEYEKYERKLKELYEVYILKFRNLAYLRQVQSEMDKAERTRQEESEQHMRQVVEKMRIEMQDTPVIEEVDEVPPISSARRQSRKVFGNMMGAGASDDDDYDDESGLPASDSEDEKHTRRKSSTGLIRTSAAEEVSSGDDF